MTRYKEIAPKFIYYLGLTMHFFVLIVFAFMNTIIFNTIETIGLLLILTFEAIWLLYFLFIFLGKTIYLKLDLENETVLYGNIFMNQEVSFDQLNDIKRKRWPRDTVQIRLSDKVYNLIAPRIDIDGTKKILQSDT